MSNIVERIIAPPPSSYEGYLYRYTNLINGMMYVGIHKGSVDDEYNHSSTNKNFAVVFANSESKLKFEVLEYGDYDALQNAENFLLKKANARKNPLYYNKSNGIPKYRDIDIDNCLDIDKQIDDGFFPITKEPISIHETMSRLQVRFQDDPALQKTIMEKINDARGSTDECTPVLVWEQRGSEGEDVRGDGNHTVFGAAASKHAVDIPVMRIPYTVHCDLTDAELRYIGNLRNKKPEIIKKHVQNSDGIKFILETAKTGVPTNSPSNNRALKSFGFTKSETRTIINNAQALLDKQEGYEKSGQIFIDYKAKPHNKTLDAKVASYNRPDLGQCSIMASSAACRLERVLECIYENRDTCNKCVVVIHHPTPAGEKAWKKDIQPYMMRICEHFNLDVEFVEMPMWMQDVSKKQKAA